MTSRPPLPAHCWGLSIDLFERRGELGTQSCYLTEFLVESSFIALSSVFVGTVLGLAVAYNFLDEVRKQPSWSNLTFSPPWLALAIILTTVYLIALATT